MLSTLDATLEHVRRELPADAFWQGYLQEATHHWSSPGIHLAVFVEPFLRYVLQGRKRIESRFSRRRSAPFERVSPGDMLLLKRSGGPIAGVAHVACACFYQLDADTLAEIRDQYSREMCADGPDFWRARESARYATLIRLEHVRSLRPVKYEKADRRGWVVLKNPTVNDAP